MDPTSGKLEASKKRLSSDKLSSSVPDIDQLCHLIDESTFGLQPFPSSSSSSSSDHQSTSASLSSKFRPVPSCQVKIFRSSRLKRLHSSSVKNSDPTDAEDQALDIPTPHYRSLYPPSRRTFSMRFSLSSSLLNRFRTLSTYHLPQSRRTTRRRPSLCIVRIQFYRRFTKKNKPLQRRPRHLHWHARLWIHEGPRPTHVTWKN
jgi:hypothetical protein